MDYTLNMLNDSLNLTQSGFREGKLLIQGTAGAGKTALLLEHYRHMICEQGIGASSVLVLLSNSSRLRSWKDNCGFEMAEGLKCFTYNRFIQEELNIFYPLLTGVCNEIGRKELKPVFLGGEPSRFLIAKAVQLRRERNGAFSGLVSTNERVASELVGNLLLAAAQGISPDEIGSRLTRSIEKIKEDKKFMLSEADEIMAAYRSKCLELGILDISESIRLYHRYLLEDDTYIQILKKRFRHILVDDLQECTPSQLRMVKLLSETAGTCIYTINSSMVDAPLKQPIHEFIGDFCEKGCERIELEGSHTCSTDLFNFSEYLMCQLTDAKEADLKDQTLDINPAFLEMHPPTELRSDMLQQLGERVISLIREEGFLPSEIVILSTYADFVTELVLSKILQEKDVKLYNPARRGRMADNPFCRALLTFARLCHPDCRLYPSRDDLKLMCSGLFTLDSVRCSILAAKINNAVPFPTLPDESWPELEQVLGRENTEKYEYLRLWTEEYIKSSRGAEPGEFLHKALLEIFLSENTAMEDILQARKMISLAMNFAQAVSRFNRNGMKDFIEMACTQAVMPENQEEREERLGIEQVRLVTPSAFLSNDIRCKVLIFCSLSSNNWLPGAAKELSNPYVLHGSWPQDEVYSGELDESNRRGKLALLLGSILKNCKEKVVTFESGLSSNGYANDGILPGLFDLTHR